MAMWGGKSPLMGAAVNGKIAEVQELLALRADPTLLNHQGHTALDMVKSKFGTVPPSLRSLLEVSHATDELRALPET